eukprot:1171808-Rhodomonas_salina.3
MGKCAFPYAMSGTDIAYATGLLCDVRYWYTACFGLAMRSPVLAYGTHLLYAMCGTDTAYGATRRRQMIAGTLRYLPTRSLCDVRY